MPEEGRGLHDTDLGKETFTTHRGRVQIDTRLSRIAEVAKTRPKERFTSLAHVLDKQTLWDCHLELPADKATGVDEVTKAEYEENLEANLDELVARMKRQAYKPQPSRRTYIPKDEKNLRPLGIPAYEDKIVQKALNKVLNAIYEQKFLDCSYGFRPGRSQHQALRALDSIIMGQPIRYVVDADIKGFFNHVDHDWLMKFLEHDIADPNFLRMIRRFLKAGIMEDGKFEETHEGTPQGGLISPILGNVYLHYVLDLWFEVHVKKHLCKGKATLAGNYHLPIQTLGVGTIFNVLFSEKPIANYRDLSHNRKDWRLMLDFLLMDHGVYTKPLNRFSMSDAHGEQELQVTIDAFEKSFAALKREVAVSL